MRLLSKQDDATLMLGRMLATCLPPASVVALYGDLGAGKTVLSRGVARGLGITEPVTSPTFTVVQEYRRPNGQYFYHLDMYRINDEQAALAFGIEEFLFAADAITLVEWPERIAALLAPAATIAISLSHIDESQREIVLPDQLGQQLLATGLPKGISLLADT
ncbi:MAG: tRNA (adenosine(37)-N6)-threonylcarbamoyltransferase complex ATPase subunit type 1 TsaE [Lentisphaeria bacterium]|jgi:tRNA threonylcarbamoyladenosine biosynthesis protein TsaE